MKIAVITFSDFNTNYGSILQSFAIKTFLESLGHEITFIRYREFNKIRGGSSIKGRIRKILLRTYFWFYRKRASERKINFQKFICNFIPHTRLYLSEEDLENNLPTQFDAYICGSDQIWNIPVLGGLRVPYFLKFAPVGKLKIAYAPSMGEYKPEEAQLNQITDLLKNFTAISTREKGTTHIISKLTKLNVQTVVDPTLLLSSDEWLKYLPFAKVPSGDYGVCYFVRRDSFCNTLVEKLRRKYKIPIYNVSDNLINVPGTDNSFVTCGPATFVRLIAGAKFCVGTSFHLAAFSVIFNKYCLISKTKHNSDRIVNLFELVNRERYCIDSSNKDWTILEDLDVSLDYMRLHKNIDKSKQFLRNSLNNGK